MYGTLKKIFAFAGSKKGLLKKSLLSEEAASIPAVDVCMEQAHDRAEAIHRSVRKVTQIRKHLTDTQFRRVWMYFVDGMTVDEIGAAEGVSHQNISKSIGAAMKKMKKLFPDC